MKQKNVGVQCALCTPGSIPARLGSTLCTGSFNCWAFLSLYDHCCRRASSTLAVKSWTLVLSFSPPLLRPGTTLKLTPRQNLCVPAVRYSKHKPGYIGRWRQKYKDRTASSQVHTASFQTDAMIAHLHTHPLTRESDINKCYIYLPSVGVVWGQGTLVLRRDSKIHAHTERGKGKAPCIYYSVSWLQVS